MGAHVVHYPTPRVRSRASRAYLAVCPCATRAVVVHGPDLLPARPRVSELRTPYACAPADCCCPRSNARLLSPDPAAAEVVGYPQSTALCALAARAAPSHSSSPWRFAPAIIFSRTEWRRARSGRPSGGARAYAGCRARAAFLLVMSLPCPCLVPSCPFGDVPVRARVGCSSVPACPRAVPPQCLHANHVVGIVLLPLSWKTL